MSTKKSTSTAKPRAAAKPKVALPALQPKKVLVNGPQKQVFIIDDATSLTSSLQCISIPHPKHGKPTRYLHSTSTTRGGMMWEVQRVYQPPSSWIMQHSVQEDGSFYMCTRIDPLFLALPFLEKARRQKTTDRDGDGVFMQTSQLITKNEFPITLLTHAASPSQSDSSSSSSAAASATPATSSAPSTTNLLLTICDTRDGWNEPVLRLSDEKVLAWLRAKVERMRHAFKKVPSLQHLYTKTEREETPEQEVVRLQEEKVKREAEAAAATEAKLEEMKEGEGVKEEEKKDSSSSSSPAASSSSTTSKLPATASLKHSLIFLSEYLPPSFFTLLLTSYSLTADEVFDRKRAGGVGAGGATKAGSSWDASGGKISGDTEITRALNLTAEKRKPEKALSSTAKKLATAAKGTKSLSSFFTAKPKPEATTATKKE